MKTILPFLLALCLLSTGMAKSPPRGVFIVFPYNDTTIDTELAWTDPNIIGVVLRIQWTDVEAVQGTYNWTYIRKGLSLCAQYNKQAIIILACGIHSPSWVHGDQGVANFTDSLGTCPRPWNNTLENDINNLVSSLQQFDTNANLVAVSMWTGGMDTVEDFFCVNSDDSQILDGLGGVSQWVNAAEFFVSAYSAHFATPLYLDPGKNYTEDNQRSMTTVAQYAIDLGCGLENNGLKNTFPDNINFPHTNLSPVPCRSIIYQAAQPLPYQSNTVAGELANAELCGPPLPGPLVVELYPGDPATDPGEMSIINFNRAVGAN